MNTPFPAPCRSRRMTLIAWMTLIALLASLRTQAAKPLVDTSSLRGDYTGVLIPAGRCANERLTISFTIGSAGELNGRLLDYDATVRWRLAAEHTEFSPGRKIFTSLDGSNSFKAAIGLGKATGTVAFQGCRYTYAAWRRYRLMDSQPLPPPANMVFIGPGTFTMGSPANEADRLVFEGPQTVVTLTRGFYMGKHEVTQGEYLEVMGTNPANFRNGVDGTADGGTGNAVTNELNHPVEQVSWHEATNYCGRLTDRERATGRLTKAWAYRLPTEAEWEYACRAGTTNAFQFGTTLRSGMANFYGRSEYDSSRGAVENVQGIYLGRTTVVGSYDPNPWGLYDMHGNVWEWCQDWWAEQLPGGHVTDPQGPPPAFDRVVRGGSWGFPAWYCRAASRSRNHDPANGFKDLGFRVVLAPVR